MALFLGIRKVEQLCLIEAPDEETAQATCEQLAPDQFREVMDRSDEYHSRAIQPLDQEPEAELPFFLFDPEGEPQRLPNRTRRLTLAQELALWRLSQRYHAHYEAEYFEARSLDGLPEGWVSGWVGGLHARKLYVGCSPEGHISS